MMNKVIKNTKKVILMVAMMAMVMGYANEGLSYTKENAKRTSLMINDVKEGNLLSIKDVNGITLYIEQIVESGIYTKGFDLTQLPDGDYLFELEKDVVIKSFPFTVTTNEVTFNKTNESTFFKPVTQTKGDLVYVNKLALNKEPLDVLVYFKGEDSKEDVLIHAEKIVNTEDKKTIGRVFKLAEKGNYRIVYYSGKREFIEYINN